ncbi:MAG TPA: division/cell wall cluster transcriptional repressor MraZ [Firmicutes bacterium]|nr:division/cell wall cluster transcriptional repressor MraZ [Bacillota bacterium]
MFMGEYQHSLDEKSRLIIPARFRDDLGEKFVLTRGLDRSLFLYPLSEWKTIEEKMKTLSTTQADARAFVRLFFSGAVECEPDKQGRISIPPHLREHAGIQRDLYILGVSTRIEIWAREVWEEYAKKAEESYETLAEKIIGIGI